MKKKASKEILPCMCSRFYTWGEGLNESVIFPKRGVVPHHFNDPIEHSPGGSSQILQQEVSNMGKRKAT